MCVCMSREYLNTMVNFANGCCGYRILKFVKNVFCICSRTTKVAMEDDSDDKDDTKR